MECPHRTGEGSGLAVSYIAGNLDARTAAAFEKHLGACPECRARTTEQQVLWLALDEWQPEAISANFNQALLERIGEQESRWRVRLNWRSAAPAAAACCMLIAAFLAKQPALTPTQPRVQIEQVERALDDMDMLSQVPVEAPAEPLQAGRL